jgi:PhoPQ-activated pathogenicity-related protein
MQIRGLKAVLCLIAALAAVSLVPSPIGQRTHAQAAASAADQTSLDRYVAQADPSYKYELVKTLPGKGYTAYVLDMTSQTWRSANEVDRTVWKHWVTIIRPDTTAYSKSLLYITGGNNNSPAPDAADRQLAQIAVDTKSVVTELRMVPNQPLVFSDDKKPRSEDAMIAYTWDKFLHTRDELWPARLPMTKAAVRAMDTVTTFLAGDAGGKLKVDAFVVAGGSKRGWTTWTTAAVDKRVVAVIPLVIDLLNIVPSFQHHFAAYGYYAPAIYDYESMGIMKWVGTPQYKALMKIEEPYEYRQRLTVPKFMINAADDPFFLPDSWQFYFHDLPGVKYLRYIPNAEHSLGGSDAFASVQACYNSVLTGATPPQFGWSIEKDGTIQVKTKDQPAEVKLWQITNPSSRDFRLTTIGAKWTSAPLAAGVQGVYSAKVAAPKRGWTAYMIELTFTGAGGSGPFKFTTGVKVAPDTLPFLEESKVESKVESKTAGKTDR